WGTGRRGDRGMSAVSPGEKTPSAHELMRTNRHKPGNMAVFVNKPRQGLRNFEDVLEAQRARQTPTDSASDILNQPARSGGPRRVARPRPEEAFSSPPQM